MEAQQPELPLSKAALVTAPVECMTGQPQRPTLIPDVVPSLEISLLHDGPSLY